MSRKKDIFAKTVEEKIKDFEVSYNSSHWSEMSDKLDTLKPISGQGTSTLLKKVLWTGVAAVMLVVGPVHH